MTYQVNAFNSTLDMAPWVGQRSNTFTFTVIDSSTGLHKGQIHPIRAGARLSHDSTRTVKRQLSFSMGVDETASVNVVADRILLSMVVPNVGTFPLGRYVFTDQTFAVFKNRNLSSCVLTDEMYVIDQPIQQGLSGVTINQATSVQVLTAALRDLPITYNIAYSPYPLAQSWSIGTGRGQVLEAIALGGDYFSPWFDNNGVLQFIRSFNPADQLVDFDFDSWGSVLQDGITQTSNLLNAPNRFVVIANNGASPAGQTVVAHADVPDSAPNSIVNRGFVVPLVSQLQVANNAAAIGIANNLANRATVVETATLQTAVDPRHDSYNVIKWNGSRWLELGWDIDLDGNVMTHTLRKAYS